MNSKAAEAVKSINRIRVAERKDPDGTRHVWHQGDDVDLISLVDREGKLQRQELTLFEDYFVWVVNQGLRTGTVNKLEGSAAAHSSELVKLDASISRERIAGASQALGAYSGADKYVLHIRYVVDQLMRGLDEHSEVVITLTRDLPTEATVNEARPGGPIGIGWIVGGVVLVAAALALLFLLR